MTGSQSAELPTELAARIAGDAWTSLILREVLLFDARRFETIQSALQLNSATLSDRLERLVTNSLLTRELDAGDGRPGYLPTQSGLDYLSPLLALAQWGQRWRPAGESPDLTIRHRRCDAHLGGDVRCAACQQPLHPADVTVETTPDFLERTASYARQRTPRLDHLERGGSCPIARTLTEIGDRWRSVLIQQAFFGTRRFEDFRTSLGIAPNILSGRLRDLTAARILQTVQYQARPRRLEYRLTPAGLDLYRVAITRWTWAEDHHGPAPGITLHHNPCNQPVRAQQYCTNCDDTPTTDTIDANRSALSQITATEPRTASNP